MVKNFIIVGTQRTGSSTLAESIGFHPEIFCGWEWTSTLPRRLKIAAADAALKGDFSMLTEEDQQHIESAYSPSVALLGYRRLFGATDKWFLHPKYSPSLWMDRIDDHLIWLRNRPGTKIIHIVREDNLDWLKSKFLARLSDSHIGKEYPAELKIVIPVREAIRRVKSKIWIDDALKSLQKSNPYQVVKYEHYLADRQQTMELIFEFLEVDACSVDGSEGKILKQSKGSISDYILNYDAIDNALKKASVRFSEL